jgi:hypothetical protein
MKYDFNIFSGNKEEGNWKFFLLINTCKNIVIKYFELLIEFY